MKAILFEKQSEIKESVTYKRKLYHLFLEKPVLNIIRIKKSAYYLSEMGNWFLISWSFCNSPIFYTFENADSVCFYENLHVSNGACL